MVISAKNMKQRWWGGCIGGEGLSQLSKDPQQVRSESQGLQEKSNHAGDSVSTQILR